MVLVQILPFFNSSFLGNIGQENLFYDIRSIERKPDVRKLSECHLRLLSLEKVCSTQ